MADEDRSAALRICCALIEFHSINAWKANNWNNIPNGVSFTVDCVAYKGVVRVVFNSSPSPRVDVLFDDGRSLQNIHLLCLYSLLNEFLTSVPSKMA